MSYKQSEKQVTPDTVCVKNKQVHRGASGNIISLAFALTICPGSRDPFYTVSYYIKLVILPGHTVQTAE